MQALATKSSNDTTAVISNLGENLKTSNASVSFIPENFELMSHFRKRINDFLMMMDGDGCIDGVYFSVAMIYRAENLLKVISNNKTESPRIGLDEDGALNFEWKNEKSFLSVILDIELNMEYYFESVDLEQPIENNANIESLKKIVQNFQNQGS